MSKKMIFISPQAAFLCRTFAVMRPRLALLSVRRGLLSENQR